MNGALAQALGLQPRLFMTPVDMLRIGRWVRSALINQSAGQGQKCCPRVDWRLTTFYTMTGSLPQL